MAIQTKTFSAGDYAWHSWSNGYVISLRLMEESVDPATNTSLVSYLFTISNTDNNRFFSNDYTWTVSIGGQSIGIHNFDFDLSSNHTTQTIASGQITVAHNADGTLDMPFSVSVPNTQAYTSYGCPAMSITGTWALAAIPVYTLSISAGTGSSVSVTRTQSGYAGVGALASGSLLYTGDTLTVVFASGSSYQLESHTLNGVSFPSGGSHTVAGDVAVVATATYIAQPPTIYNVSIADGNPETVVLTGDSAVMVRGRSNAVISAYASAHNGASIARLVCTCADGQQFASASGTLSGTINGVYSGDFAITATDSRGNTNIFSASKVLIPYVNLTVDIGVSINADGTGIVSCSGNWFNGTFGATENTLEVQYRYKEQGGTYSGWYGMDASAGGNTYTASASFSGFDYQTTYVFQARALDRLSAVPSSEKAVKSCPVFDWGENDFNVNGTFKINNTELADFVVAQGASGGWEYRKWNSGIGECWRNGIALYDDNSSVAPGTVYTNSLALPFYFANDAWCASFVPNGVDNSTNVVLGIPWKTQSTFVVRLKNNASTNAVISTDVYIIGRWK